MGNLQQLFINNLKIFRKQKGLRQIDLALEIGKSSNYINSIENGKYFPSPDTIEKICQCLDIEAFQLFQKQEKTDNLKENKNTEISQNIIENLYAKLKEDLYKFLKKDIETILGNVKNKKS